MIGGDFPNEVRTCGIGASGVGASSSISLSKAEGLVEITSFIGVGVAEVVGSATGGDPEADAGASVVPFSVTGPAVAVAALSVSEGVADVPLAEGVEGAPSSLAFLAAGAVLPAIDDAGGTGGDAPVFVGTLGPEPGSRRFNFLS